MYLNSAYIMIYSWYKFHLRYSSFILYIDRILAAQCSIFSRRHCISVEPDTVSLVSCWRVYLFQIASSTDSTKGGVGGDEWAGIPGCGIIKHPPLGVYNIHTHITIPILEI